MIKTICIISCLLISTPVFAGGGDTQNGVTVEQDIDKVLERVDSAGEWMSGTLEKLAEKLGTTVSYLWPTFVREVVAEGLVIIISAILMIVFSIVLSIMLRKARNNFINDEGWTEGALACNIFMWIIPIVCMSICIPLACSAITQVVAPEPEALHNLSEAVRMLKQ